MGAVYEAVIEIVRENETGTEVGVRADHGSACGSGAGGAGDGTGAGRWQKTFTGLLVEMQNA